MLRQHGSSIIHANRAQWIEVKLREIAREQRKRKNRTNLTWLWLNPAQTVARYTWVPLFIWIQILPLNIKHQKAASSVSEIRWCFFRGRSDFFSPFFFFFVFHKGAAFFPRARLPSHAITCGGKKSTHRNTCKKHSLKQANHLKWMSPSLCPDQKHLR